MTQIKENTYKYLNDGQMLRIQLFYLLSLSQYGNSLTLYDRNFYDLIVF